MTPEEKLGEIMGQQDAIATLLAQLMIKYAPAFFEDKEAKQASEQK